jgi:hypothetical protein
MSSCKGLHCPGCGDGGGWGLAVVALVVLAVISANARAIGRGVSELVTAAVIVLGAAVGLVAIAAAAVVVVRVRRRTLARRRAVRYEVTAQLAGRVVPGLPGRAPLAALPVADTNTQMRNDAGTHVVTGRVPSPRCAKRARRWS